MNRQTKGNTISAILLLTSAILVLYPRILLALTKDAKVQIIGEELKTAINEVAQSKVDKVTSPKITEAVSGETGLPDAFCKPITIRSNGAALRVIMQKIAGQTGYNVIYSASVDPEKTIIMDVLDVPIWRAMNTMLFPLTWGFKVIGSDLIILAKATNAYKISLPPGSESYTDTIANETSNINNNSNSSSAGSSGTAVAANKSAGVDVKFGTKIFVENKQLNLSFWDDIEENLKKMLSPTGIYTLNRPAGIVFVTDNPDNLDRITGYFALVNEAVSKQIFIDVKIAEVTLSGEKTYGIDWNAIYHKLGKIKNLQITSNFGATNIVSGNMFTLSAAGPKTDSGISSQGENAVIRALESQGDVKIISQPKLMLLQNQSATIQVGTISTYVAQTTTSVSQGVSTVSATTDQVQEGVSLRLMGSINKDDIALQLTPVVSTVDQIRSISVGTNTNIEAPKVSSKSMHTLVRIKDGETIAIGGLITSKTTKNEAGIPFLRKLPVVGGMFDYRTNQTKNTELVIFVTAKAVAG